MSTHSFSHHTTTTAQALPKQKPKTQWLIEKDKLCVHQQILEDLDKFTCKCRPCCLRRDEDATMVGFVRNTVRKLGTRVAVRNHFYFRDLFDKLIRNSNGALTRCAMELFICQVQQLQRESTTKIGNFASMGSRYWLLVTPSATGKQASSRQWIN